MSKLSIQSEMRALDTKDRDFYDNLDDDDKKAFAPFLMIRWGSCVNASPELQYYYLVSANRQMNKNFFSVPGSADRNHKKLQWLMATTISPGMGTYRHEWISNKKESSSIRKKLAELYPKMKDDELDLLAKITTQKELDTHLKGAGLDEGKKKK